ncbi:hypothetical protein LB505_009375 [Fusarium chuoi]|nr:hypothetical protein LB505_009375 [Fusarium chuoi]
MSVWHLVRAKTFPSMSSQDVLSCRLVRVLNERSPLNDCCHLWRRMKLVPSDHLVTRGQLLLSSPKSLKMMEVGTTSLSWPS